MKYLWILPVVALLGLSACADNRNANSPGGTVIHALKTGDTAVSNSIVFTALKRGGSQTFKMRFRAPADGQLRMSVPHGGLGVNCEAKGNYSKNYEVQYSYLTRDLKTGLFTAPVKVDRGDLQPVIHMQAGAEIQIVVELFSMCTCDSATVDVQAAFVRN